VVANYITSFRAPALEELYNRGPHLGNVTFELGNSSLIRERAHGFELSVRHHTDRLRLELIGFHNRISDFVYLAPTGAEEGGLLVAEYDQADARYIGAEARLDFRVLPNIWLNTGFDVVDAQIKESRTPLPRIPPVRGRAGVEFRRGGFFVRPELILSNRQWQIFPTETPTAGYAVGQLTTSYIFTTNHTSHMIGFNWFNVNNALYRNHLSFIKDIAPEIGRGVRLSYTLNFF
jgi:iron complex outermembrane receptor protein